MHGIFEICRIHRLNFLVFLACVCIPAAMSQSAIREDDAQVEKVSEQVIIVGAGTSASALARGLSDSGVTCLVLETGTSEGAAHKGGVAERIGEWARAAATPNEVSVNYQTEPQRSLGGRR
jgi:ribulose 1,5-bisphosphate synthetase/thiazole synthase